jgi:phosphate transport system substrate-binding protein
MRASALILLAALALAGCGSERESADDDGNRETTAQSDLSGRIEADGSSTVGPYTTAAAERFRTASPDVRVTVGVSGTGGGFERFCAGETDLSNASRAIKDEERELCEREGVEFVEFHIANDALTVVVNAENDWATCLTVDELRNVWEPGSKVGNWSQIRAGFPDERLRLFGAGTDSGTFDYFTDVINGEEGASRSDYAATEDDNVTVEGVSGNRGGMGYFGLSYYLENKSRLKVLRVDGGNGCQTPSVATVQNRAYKPLSRALFIYVKRTSFNKAIMRAFIKYVIQNEKRIASTAKMVPLTPAQIRKAKRQYNTALANRA